VSAFSESTVAGIVTPDRSTSVAPGRVAAFLAPAVAVAIFLAVWELWVRLSGIRPIILPAPSTVAATTAEQWETLALHTWATFSEAALASLLAIIGGSLLAVVMTQFEIVARAVTPYVLLSQVVPKIALAPLFVVWLGIGAPARLTMAFVIAFFPMVIDVSAGLLSVPADRLRLARLLGSSQWQVLRYLRIPSAIPHFFTGAKISVTVAIVGIIVSEFVAAERGLG
jgi:NitT/TauT family transport system permease protein